MKLIRATFIMQVCEDSPTDLLIAPMRRMLAPLTSVSAASTLAFEDACDYRDPKCPRCGTYEVEFFEHGSDGPVPLSATHPRALGAVAACCACEFVGPIATYPDTKGGAA